MKQINNIGQLLNHLKVLVYLLSLYILGQSLDHPKMLVLTTFYTTKSKLFKGGC